MNIEAIERDFHNKVSDAIRLSSEGTNRFRIYTPFAFDDGDHLSIVLKRDNGYWVLSDEGHTYMHLTYEMDERDLLRGTRQKVIANALSMFSIDDREGELVTRVHDGEYGNALYSFIQGLVKISDVNYLNRERIRSTFLEDFNVLMTETIPEHRRTFRWHDPIRDPQGMYVVDCRVNGTARPLFVYALPGDDATRDATIGLLQFEKWALPHRSMAVFEDQEEINRKVLARFSDVCQKMFSSLGSRERIITHIKEYVEQST